MTARPTLDPLRVLRIDSSARRGTSVSRSLADELVDGLRSRYPAVEQTVRDLAGEPLPYVNEAWIGARNAHADDLGAEQRSALEISDTLVRELIATDVIVIAAPVYNFGVPAALKAWIDLAARPGLTFRYTAAGPEGLLQGKRAFLVITSGGTAVGGAEDFVSGYLRHVLGFLGVRDVETIAADGLMLGGSAPIVAARERMTVALDTLPGLSELRPAPAV